jgi:protein gp37
MLCGAIEDLVRAHPTTRATRGPWPGMLVEALQRRDPGVWPLPSVWLGVSAEDQATLDARAPFLMRTPAALRWLSAEPLLGRIDARRWFGKELEASVSSLWLRGFDWVVAGGESAQPWEKARPTHPEWGTFLQAQCAEYGVPFLWKQWGEWAPVTRNAASRVAHRHDPRWHNWPDVGDESPVSLLVGRDKAGDLLNGQRWQQFPVAA